MFCTKCGKQNQDDAVFCSSCGAKIGSQGPSIEPIALSSVPPAAVNPASIAMFKVKYMGIAMEMDDVWGERVFRYLTPQEMYDDCNKIFIALQQLTKNMVVQFKSEGGPAVPIYRMKKVYANDWWKRLEIDIEGAGGQWFQYADKNAMYADYNMLMDLMRSSQQQ